MGGGFYSTERAASISSSYKGMDTHEVFTNRKVIESMAPDKVKMTPDGVKMRESRDSEDHPESLAVIIGLDVTGSMCKVPDYMVREGLIHVMNNIIEGGYADPQVLFAAIGDHEYDRAPLQVGQFESSDELLDHWLKNVWLEGRGGANDGESYHLAWMFAAMHTSIDCWEKRKQKGFLFTIGDEPVLPNLPGDKISDIMGGGQYKDYTAKQLLKMAQKKYHVYHIHIVQGMNGNRQEVIDGWRELLGDHLLIAQSYEDVSNTIATLVNKQAMLTFHENMAKAGDAPHML